MREQQYQDLITECVGNLSILKKRSNGIGMVKLGIAMAFVVDLFFLFEGGSLPQWIIGILCLGSFLVCVYLHSRILEKIQHEEFQKNMAEQNISRIDGTWTKFDDRGEEFLDQEHIYASDLDIVGDDSLFQYLNGTNTYHGRQQLIKDLMEPGYDCSALKERQRAIAELSENYEFIAELSYQFSKVGVDQTMPALLEELRQSQPYTKRNWSRILLRVLWSGTMVSLTVALISQSNTTIYLSAAMLALQTVVCRLGSTRAKCYVAPLYHMTASLLPYVPALNLILEQKFTSPKLMAMQQKVEEHRRSLEKLGKIAENVKQTHNLMAAIILNILFLWNYKNAFDFSKWRLKYGAAITECFEALGELESLLSFTNLNRNCGQVCAPELIEIAQQGKKCFQAAALGHPLIAQGKRKVNDFAMDSSVAMISGSNMSGKSTFMRTVGINMVLANAGSYVCAASMTCSLWQPVTSMRIVDSTQEGISTFYSELLRIKKLIDYTVEQDNAFFLIDEIFRGTNSVDRLKGAQEVMKRLLELGAWGMITTHDLELCKMEEGTEQIRNYSFYENYQGEDMYFDYQIKEGIAKTTNAEFLLRKIGIINS